MNIGTSVDGSWCSSVGGVVMGKIDLSQQEDEQALAKKMYETYGLRLVHDELTPEESDGGVIMVKIYTEESRVSNLEKNNDFFFNTRTCNEKMTSVDIDIMQKIDHAVLKAGNRIETPYGLGYITNLSTGCKTVINILKHPDIIFSVDECGANVIELLFRMKDVKFFMSYPTYVHIGDDTIIQFNNIDIVSGEDAFYTWWQRKGNQHDLQFNQI